MDCGYDRSPRALEFHHVDAGTKDFDISSFLGSLDRLRQEVAKCVLLCANCHRSRHAISDAKLDDPDLRARRALKQRAVALLGGRCHDCDAAVIAPVFEFHHLDKRQKDFGISQDGVARAWHTIVTELEKCVLLCANCHRERHA